jgi:L-ribulokinase
LWLNLYQELDIKFGADEMAEKNYVIGVDYGTDSVRSIIVDAANGAEISSAVYYYPRWKEGKYCVPAKNQFRQHPWDYLEGLENTIQTALINAPAGTAEAIRGISVDTTGSTPVAVNREGTPLALTQGFESNPNAMFVLWKDHTAVREAAEINTLARSWGGVDYTKFEGGVYSSEWFWAKILHILRQDDKVRKAAFSWVEHCDWIPAVLTGKLDPLTMVRSRCAAGHKAMWHEAFGGLPDEAFLVKLDPLLKGLAERLFKDTFTCETVVGTITHEWAARLNLPEDVKIGAGAFDAHMGAVGGEIKPFILSKVIGTSTCDMLIAPMDEFGDKLVAGICGQVDGSIVPHMLGMEAGQSAFGDVFAWFKELLLWPVENILKNYSILDARTRDKIIHDLQEQVIPLLSQAAEKVSIDESGMLALDWLNGRRTPYANQALKGAITGLSLGSDAPAVFRALVEATAFGAKKIADRFIEEGVKIDGVIALGGIPKKSPFIMQVLADVMNMPIKVAKAEQACALGAAMCAATAAGLYPTVEAAQQAMGNGFEKEYKPDRENAVKYKRIYEKYLALADFVEHKLSPMHR